MLSPQPFIEMIKSHFTVRIYTAIVLIICAAPVALWQIFAHGEEAKFVREIALESLGANAKRSAVAVRSLFERQIIFLQNIANTVRQENLTSISCDPWLEPFVATSPEILSFVALDESAAAICELSKNNGSAKRVAQTIVANSWITVFADQSYRIFVIKPQRREERTTAFVAHRVESGDGRLLGLIGVEIDLIDASKNALAGFLGTATFTILSEDGTLAMRWPDPEKHIGRITDSSGNFPQDNELHFYDFPDETGVGAFIKIKGTEWRAIAWANWTELYVDARTRIDSWRIATFSAIAFLFTCIIYASTLVARPLERLQLFLQNGRASREDVYKATAWAPFELRVIATRLASLLDDAVTSERRWREIIEASPIPCAIIRGDSIEYMNRAYTATLGYTADDVPTVEAWYKKSVADDETRAKRRADWQKFWQGGATANIEGSSAISGGRTIEVTAKDGRTLNLTGFVTRLHWADELLLVSLLDVTTERKLQEEITRSERNYRALIEALPVAAVAVDGGGSEIKFVNHTFRDLIGYTLEEVPTTGALRQLLFPDPTYKLKVFSSWLYPFNEMMGTGRSHDPLEVKIQTKSGKVLDMLAQIHPIGAEIDYAWLISLIDITGLKSAEAERESTYRQLSFALASARGGTWSYSLVDRTISFSDQWYEMTGYRLGVVGPRIDEAQELIHPDDFSDMQKRFADYVSGRENNFVSEHRLRFADGEYHWIIDRGQFSEFDADGRPTRMVGIHMDITESKEIREKLAQSDKLSAVGQLAGGIAHDVNNMLAVILGNAEMIAESAKAGSRVHSMASRIVASASRGAELTSRMLMFSRKSDIQPVNLELGSTLVDVIATLRRTLGGRVDIRVEPPAEPIWVYVDRAMLESCLINLSVNARDAMPEGGVLTFAVSSERTTAAEGDKDWAVLRVTDTGVGMSEEIRKRVFEPFFTTKPMGGGTGLGLSMVYGFVQQSGGSIEVESTPGQGTTFTVRFPRVQAAAASAQAEAPDTQAGAGHTVLVVEDNELVRFTLKEQLEGIGCRVVEAQNVAAAMACIEHDPTAITFILTDLDLGPGPTGLDLAEWVEKQGYDYPGAIVSGYLNVPNDQITQLGWIRIQKPVQIKDFAKLLSTPFAKGKKTEQPSIGQLTASS